MARVCSNVQLWGRSLGIKKFALSRMTSANDFSGHAVRYFGASTEGVAWLVTQVALEHLESSRESPWSTGYNDF